MRAGGRSRLPAGLLTVGVLTRLPPLLPLLLQLVGLGALLGSQHGIEFGESLRMDGRHLAQKIALTGGKLLNGGIAIPRLGRFHERLAILLQLLSKGLRRLSGLLENDPGLLLLRIGQVQRLGHPRHTLAYEVMRPALRVWGRGLCEHHPGGQGRDCCKFHQLSFHESVVTSHLYCRNTM
jgi:hypothetical protein